ncbi:MAG TPA: beta-eliminating lyase-related protein [Steroidobacteraceae bacterium]|nr:beta-eliminating lyase-related protein [Steroidobacteraceae bacterium]
MRFYSDNNATVCPELLAAIHEANSAPTRGYGDDRWTQALDEAFGRFFGTAVKVFPVTTGTAANALALATTVPPYGAVYAHDEAHVVRDECGAPEFFSGGLRLVSLHGGGAMLDAATLERALDAMPPSVHTVQPAAVTITQATELGRVYQPAAIAALAALAHARGLHVHMDGARIANALATLGCSPAAVTWQAGVDVLSFGATKNGGLAAEAVVFFRPDLVRDFELRRKRAGHLLSKSRYVSAQLLAYVSTDVWRRNAERANSAARRIGAACTYGLLEPVEANEVFVRIGEPAKATLRARGFEFYDWGAAQSGEARFVASWDQDPREVDALCRALAELQNSGGAISPP